jgi:hypothetical protein
MIQKIGKKWVLFSHKGKVLGTHRTRADAVSQEHAVNLSKARKAGHRIPYAPKKRR